MLRYDGFAGMDANLETYVRNMGYQTQAHGDGLILSSPTWQTTWSVRRLADAESMHDLDARWTQCFGVESSYELAEPDRLAFANSAREQMRTRSYGWFAWLPMHLPDEGDVLAQSLAIHRDALFPAFFEAHPRGRVLAVTYDRESSLMSCLAALNVLIRLRRHGLDQAKMMETAGKNAMSALGLHTPVYFLWYSLYLAFAAFFPDAHGFVATLQHQAFLVYLLPKGERDEDHEPGWFERNMPGLSMASSEGVTTRTGNVRFRTSPLGANRQTYAADDLERYIETIVLNAERMLTQFADITRYVDREKGSIAGEGDELKPIDLDFARNTLVTLFVLLRRTIKMTVNPDPFERKMTLYDVLDLHGALVSVNPREESSLFKHFAHRDYAIGELSNKLRAYPGLPGSDLRRGLQRLRESATKTIRGGILEGFDWKTVSVPPRRDGKNEEAIVRSLDDFEVDLLRALRNTKHGYETRDANLLGMHTGDVHEDFPDYALALMLGLLADPQEYESRR